MSQAGRIGISSWFMALGSTVMGFKIEAEGGCCVDCVQPAAAVMLAACCGMEGGWGGKAVAEFRPRQQAGRPESGSRRPQSTVSFFNALPPAGR